jgi:hypothetical protein
VTCGRLVVFSGYSGFLPNKTDRHDITEILLKVALNTINHKPDRITPITPMDTHTYLQRQNLLEIKKTTKQLQSHHTTM